MEENDEELDYIEEDDLIQEEYEQQQIKNGEGTTR